MTPMEVYQLQLEAYELSIKNYNETPQVLKDMGLIYRPTKPAPPIAPAPPIEHYSGRVPFAQKYGRRIIRR